MSYTIIARDYNNVLYTIAHRNLPLFEIGINVPNYSYYIQSIESKQHDIFDTTFKPPKKLSIGDVMKLSEDKINAILQTIALINKITAEIN